MSVVQPSLFGLVEDDPAPKPAGDQPVKLRLIVTVKAAPNPSDKYGETVCVAGLSIDPLRPGWIRLYPINFRDLGDSARFKKYDVISIDAKPARQDQRRESFRPIMSTMLVDRHLSAWSPRRPWLDPMVSDSMCAVNAAVKGRSDARSLALIRPRTVTGLRISPHPGWTAEEQKKIDAYVQQADLLDEHDRTPLEAPRFKAAYRYQCHETACRGHEQGLLDWEFVAFQRRIAHLGDPAVIEELQRKFLTMMCDPGRDTAFFVGNQAKRPNVFSVLGVYYPSRR